MIYYKNHQIVGGFLFNQNVLTKNAKETSLRGLQCKLTINALAFL